MLMIQRKIKNGILWFKQFRKDSRKSLRVGGKKQNIPQEEPASFAKRNQTAWKKIG